MQKLSCIAVDAMGGDFGPRVTVQASLDALARHPNLQIKLVGDEKSLLSHTSGVMPERLSIVHAHHQIQTDSRISQVLRGEQDTSMQRALGLITSNEAEAVVSAGNTGALMALGRRALGTLDGIDRPAVTAAVPTLQGQCQVLDLGANIDCSPEMLLQFAILGSALVRAERGVSCPRLGLLNIGAEQTKGTDSLRVASAFLSKLQGVEYIGFVEGDDLFAGRADLVVCDGLIGNVALKSSEGLAHLIRQKVSRSFKRSLYRRILAFLSKPILKELESELDAGARNGAMLIGLRGVVIKSHGSASVRDFGFAIDHTYHYIQAGVCSQLREDVARHLQG